MAAESSLFRHPGEVYFRATACFDLHSLYTRAFASFLESVETARKSACATKRYSALKPGLLTDTSVTLGAYFAATCRIFAALPNNTNVR